jgi:hypothetical protein
MAAAGDGMVREVDPARLRDRLTSDGATLDIS